MGGALIERGSFSLLLRFTRDLNFRSQEKEVFWLCLLIKWLILSELSFVAGADFRKFDKLPAIR